MSGPLAFVDTHPTFERRGENYVMTVTSGAASKSYMLTWHALTGLIHAAGKEFGKRVPTADVVPFNNGRPLPRKRGKSS